MRSHLNLPAIFLPLALALAAGVAEAQLPERTRPAPPTPGDPTVPPPLPTNEPGFVNPPTAVQPGTILRDPVLPPTRELNYTPLGEAPGTVQVTATGARSVTLSWSAPAGASGYWIHQAGAGQTTYYRGGSLVTETTATVTRLLPATTYSFKVSAVYPQEMQRREGISEAVSGTTAPAPVPSGLAASVTGTAQVTLTWDQLAGADWFRLHRNGVPLTDIKPIAVNPGGPATLRTTYDDPVGPGTYLYRIQAVYLADGAEAVSAAVPEPPVSVTIKASTRVRYCQTRAGRSACGQPGPAPAVIARTAFGMRGGETP